jgi:hypothetical protein
MIESCWMGVDLHVASCEFAKLTKKKRRVILVAVALKQLISVPRPNYVYLQSSSQK